MVTKTCQKPWLAPVVLTLVSFVGYAHAGDLPASTLPAFQYDEPDVQLPPLSGRLFSFVAVGYLTGGETPWLVMSTGGHGVGTSFYSLRPHAEHRWVAGPVLPWNASNAPQTIVDWDGDGTDDLVRIEKGTCRLYLMTPKAESPTPREIVDLARPDGNRNTFHAEHIGVVFRKGVPDIVAGYRRIHKYFPGEEEIRSASLSLGGGFDEMGIWRGDFGTGFVTYYRNLGTAAAPRFANAEVLKSGRGYVSATHSIYPTAADWTGDGLFDLSAADFNGQLWFYRNIGTVEKPYFDLATPQRDCEGNALAVPQCMARNAVFDWDGDGGQDLIVGSEDGFVYVMRHTGRDALGHPTFAPPFRVRGVEPEIDIGVLTVQNFVDWDEDGDRDIVFGNAAGELTWVENGGTDAAPRYRVFKPLLSEGKPVRLLALANGSTQGPNEATWGYTCPSVCDWNDDGHPDLILGNIFGSTLVYLNDGQGAMDEGHALTVEGRSYRNVWRVRPIAVDWDGDDTLEVIYLDPKGRLGLHERGSGPFDLQTLRPFRYADGGAMELDGHGGFEGRCKLCVVDWDGDGDLDVLTGVKGGTPMAMLTGDNSKILWLERIDDRDGVATFKRPKTLGMKDGPFPLGDHTQCPEPYFYAGSRRAQNTDADGDGFAINPAIEFLTLTSEDGRLYRIERDLIQVVHTQKTP